MQVFVSYCHADERWLKRLRVHLAPSVQSNALAIWDDRRIGVGSSWRDEIAEAIASSDAAILVVSADFLASEFVTSNELPPLLLAARTRQVPIMPLIVGACGFSRHEHLGRFQAFNDPARPLNAMSRPKAETVLAAAASVVHALSLRGKDEPQSTEPRLDAIRIPFGGSAGPLSPTVRRRVSAEHGVEIEWVQSTVDPDVAIVRVTAPTKLRPIKHLMLKSGAEFRVIPFSDTGGEIELMLDVRSTEFQLLQSEESSLWLH